MTHMGVRRISCVGSGSAAGRTGATGRTGAGADARRRDTGYYIQRIHLACSVRGL